MPTYSWVSPTGHIEPSGDWHNPANAYDGNWATNADVQAHYWDGISYPTNYLTLTFAALMYIDRLNFKYNLSSYAGSKIQIDVWNQDMGAWDSFYLDGVLDFDTTVELIIPTKHTDRVRIRAELSGVSFLLYELRAEQVTPDLPAPPPAPPNPPETIDQKIEERTQSPTLGFTRIRTLHRTTKLKPWVI